MAGSVGNYLWNLAALACGREPSRPLLASWYVTHRCALNCRYCSDGSGRPFREDRVPELGLVDAERLLGILREATDTLDLTGGEPLLRPDLEQILALAKAKFGFRTILNTKGIGLAGRSGVLEHLDTLVLSVDALEAAMLGKITGQASAGPAILDTLAFIIGRPKAAGPKVVLSAVAMPDNLVEVRRVLELAVQHGLGFHLSPELQGTVVNPELRGSLEYRDLVETVRERKRQGAGVLGVDAYLCGIRDFRRFRCHPRLMAVVRPDGQLLYPCLEKPQARIDLLTAGNWKAAQEQARQTAGPALACGDECQIFCHMALSLAQRHPLAAMHERV